MQGRKLTDVHKSRISDARKRQAVPDVVVLAECKGIARRRRRWCDTTRIKQWRHDMFVALQHGHYVLFEDIRRSAGWARWRRIQRFPGVTDGYTNKQLKAAYKQTAQGKVLRYGQRSN
jgi:hypothetical protein